MKYRIGCVLFLLIGFGISQPSFSYFENKMYCNIDKGNIIISLETKKFYTCNVYVNYIEKQMKKVYMDILAIDSYIDKKQDLGYRNPLKSEKTEFLTRLQNMRLNLISHMKTFESNLLTTSKKYFLDNISDYRKKLDRTLQALLVAQNSQPSKYVGLVQEQIAVIQKISQATTFEQLNASIQRYVYLKQQIEGK